MPVNGNLPPESGRPPGEGFRRGAGSIRIGPTEVPMKRLSILLTCLLASAAVSAAQPKASVADVLKNAAVIAIPERGRPVDRTVAEALKAGLAPQAEIKAVPSGSVPAGPAILRVAVADEGLAQGPGPGAPSGPAGWMHFRLDPDGGGEIVASKPNLLYALYRLIAEDWAGLEASGFAAARTIAPTFARLEGGDNYMANPKRIVTGYDIEASMKELARLGYSHVPVNALAKDLPAEEAEPGEIYTRFYYFSPDLDQFVETPLNAGAYTAEYLQANLELLKRNAALAVKYGLTPGLNISTPRSVPDSIQERHPYLRGARVDHPFRSYRPRYTLTLSHPAVRWHYAELMRRVMKEVPELGYLYIWTNDSGSGFEYTASLYAGRNGGAYLVREWKNHDDIAKAAAENAARYFRLLRDAARETNPEFRILMNLFSFSNEENPLMDALDAGVDLWIAPQELDGSERAKRLQALPAKGCWLFSTTRLQNNFLLGIPFPWLARDMVRRLTAAGLDKAAVTVDPPSLAPYDINRDILRAGNFEPEISVDDAVQARARAWVGAGVAPRLVEAWRLADRAVRGMPPIMLYGDNNWGFTWYRLLVRPFAPDIARIPESERAYYERFMTVTFNNPNLVDLGQDILWTLLSREQADAAVAQADREVWTSIDGAIELLDRGLAEAATPGAKAVFADQRDRLEALRTYFRTLRNTAAWVAGVHGYLEAKARNDKPAMDRRRAEVRAMVDDEAGNAEALAALFERSTATFMPVAPAEESFNLYGANLPALARRKAALMRAHRDDEPAIDPNFIWRVPSGFPVDPRDFLKY